MTFSLLMAHCSLPLFAADLSPRLYFSDAKLSFGLPDHWMLSKTFPFGPMLERNTQEGTTAYVVCQISDPVDAARLAADTSLDVLKKFAAHDLAQRAPAARTVANDTTTVAGQNAYETTWLNEGEVTTQSQSVYFFMDNRFYVLSLQSNRNSFPWLVQEFQTWLKTVRILSRQNSGKLDSPSRGGYWVHQTGGARIVVPDDWLIGVADDRQLGAALARDKMYLEFTAVVDSLAPAGHEMTAEEKEAARRPIKVKGAKILSESEEPFHGLPAYRIVYEDTVKGRFIRGQDIWIWNPKARWLLNVEGDARLLRQVSEEWQTILSNIHFYP